MNNFSPPYFWPDLQDLQEYTNLLFPLYFFDPADDQGVKPFLEKFPNLNPEILNKIAAHLHLTFTPEKLDADGNVCFANCPEIRDELKTSFAPIDILDYIYAVLHSPAYREKYKEFLKIDFPRVPYPKDAATFWNLVKLGGEIRQIHLLESPVVSQYITKYPLDGDNLVDKPKYVSKPTDAHTGALQGDVFINDTQYFANVPLAAWKFYIGGYQPAQKWLKDRKGRTLEFDDILHYQKIIVALSETDRLMQEVDKIGVE